MSEQFLFHYGKKTPEFENLGVRTYWGRFFFSPVAHICQLFLMLRAEKIFIHSLAAPSLLVYLFLFPKLNKKTYWIIWGKDLYYYRLKLKHNAADHVYEFIRKRVFPKIRTIVTILGEDYEVAREHYNVGGRHIEGNFVEGALWQDVYASPPNSNNCFNILLGNSASETNNHIEAMKLLQHRKEEIAKIYCFLSYGGNDHYAQTVSKAGQALFSQKFQEIYAFLDDKKYLDILQNCDVGVFNNYRQEGLTTIIYMIKMKKTLYLNKRSSTWKFFERVGIKVHDIETLINRPIQFLDDAILEKNKNIVLELFHENKFKNLWQELFSEPLPS